MADKSGLFERESAAFANDNKPVSGVPREHLDFGPSVSTGVKLQEMEELLENTLNNNINLDEPLTKRETEILHLVVSGKTNKEIAQMLCRTERTIEYHRNSLMRKLDVHNAAELVRRAIAVGIVS
jgi:two-component system secretion response regulator SsrB